MSAYIVKRETIGNTWIFGFPVEDEDGNPVTADSFKVCFVDIDNALNKFEFDENDLEVSIASGLITLEIPDTTTATYTAGTYTVDWSVTSGTYVNGPYLPDRLIVRERIC